MLNINKSNIYYNGDSMRYMFKRVNRVLTIILSTLIFMIICYWCGNSAYLMLVKIETVIMILR